MGRAARPSHRRPPRPAALTGPGVGWGGGGGAGPEPLSSSQRQSPAPLPAPSRRLRRDPLSRSGRAPQKVEPVTRLAGPADDPKAPRSKPGPRSSSPMATRRGPGVTSRASDLGQQF